MRGSEWCWCQLQALARENDCRSSPRHQSIVARNCVECPSSSFSVVILRYKRDLKSTPGVNQNLLLCAEVEPLERKASSSVQPTATGLRTYETTPKRKSNIRRSHHTCTLPHSAAPNLCCGFSLSGSGSSRSRTSHRRAEREGFLRTT